MAVLVSCAESDVPVVENPNEGLLRDFLDGKFDGAGHPLNAKTIDSCAGELAAVCEAAIPAGATTGPLVINLRLRVVKAPSSGSILKAIVIDDDGNEIARESLTVSRLRGRANWIDLAINLDAVNASKLRLEPQGDARVEIDYAEVFPKNFGLVVAPGSGVIADDELLTFELAKLRKLERLDAGGVDLLPKLEQLLDDGIATKTTTGFRTLIEVPVGALLPERGDTADLQIRGAGDAARVELRRTAHACNYEGTGSTKVLITGFQPFPADGTHPNISAESPSPAWTRQTFTTSQLHPPRAAGRVRPRTRDDQRGDRALRPRHRDQLRPGRRFDRPRADRLQPPGHRRDQRWRPR